MMTSMNPWDQRFSRSSDYLYGEAPNAWIVQAMPQLPVNAKVLALADGEGRNAVWLAAQGYDVINIDYAQVGLDKTQLLAQKRAVKVKTLCADLTQYAFPEQYYDVVVASFFHLPSAHQLSVWQNVIAAIKPNGYLIVQVFSTEQQALQSGGPKDTDLLYRLAFWEGVLQSMRVEVLASLETHLDEGDLHQGVAKVINIKSIK